MKLKIVIAIAAMLAMSVSFASAQGLDIWQRFKLHQRQELAGGAHAGYNWKTIRGSTVSMPHLGAASQ